MKADREVDLPLAPRAGIYEFRILQGRGSPLNVASLGVNLKV